MDKSLTSIKPGKVYKFGETLIWEGFYCLLIPSNVIKSICWDIKAILETKVQQDINIQLIIIVLKVRTSVVGTTACWLCIYALQEVT